MKKIFFSEVPQSIIISSKKWFHFLGDNRVGLCKLLQSNVMYNGS